MATVFTGPMHVLLHSVPQPCSRPPLTHTSSRDFWTLMDKSGSVSCGITAPLSWVLVHRRFLLCPPRVYSPVLCKFWQLYDGVNGDLLQKIPCMHCYTHCPQPCSRPPGTHASAGDSRTLRGKSGSVSSGVTAPFSWVLVHTRFCLCPPRVYFPVLCKFWWLYGRVNGDLLSKVLCHTQVYCSQRPCP